MKSLKRIIASTLSVLMILASLLTVNVFADTVVFPDVADDYAYRSAIYSLVDKGVINGIEENGVLNFKPDNTITRAEFAKLVAVALTGGVALTETTAQFPDVAQDYWANVHIAYAVKTGIVNGYPDGTFRPQNPVTYGEAVKMLVCAKGYGAAYTPTEPWYDGYVRLANQIELTKNAFGLGTNEASRGLVAQLVYNMDYTKKIEISTPNGTIGGNGGIDVEDEYEETTGVVEGVFDTTLTGQSMGLNKLQVMIDGTVYKIDEDHSIDSYYQYLGKMVSIEYSDESVDVIKKIDDYGDNDTITIKAEDIDSVTSNSIKYYASATSSKLSEAKLASKLYVIYNGYGVALSDIDDEFIETYLDIDCGEITLMDNNGGKDFEVAYVTSYETFYVASKSSSEDVYTISDNKANKSIALDADDCTVKKITKQGGNIESSSLSSISTNNIISVAKPYDRTEGTEVIISAISEKNKSVDEISGDDYVTIDEKEYAYSDYFKALAEANPSDYTLSVGDTATFYFDYSGKLVYFTKSESTDPYAYVLGFDEGTGVSGECSINLYAISGSSAKVIPYPLKSTVRVNGSSESASNVGNILMTNAGVINAKYEDNATIENGEYGQLIKYKTTTSNGVTYVSEIFTIDSTNLENGDIVPAAFRAKAEDSKEAFSDGKSKLTYNTSSKAFKDAGGSNQFIINSSTIIIQVPKDRSNGSDFKKRSTSHFSNDGTYIVEPYDVKSNVAKVVLLYGGSTAVSVYYNTNAVFVDNIREKENDEGDAVKQLTYYNAGENTTKTILTEKLNTLDGIGQGDVVKLAIEDGVVVAVQKVFVDGVLYDWESADPFDVFVAEGNFIEHGSVSTPDSYQVIHGTVDSVSVEDGAGTLTVVPMIVDNHENYDNSDWKSFTITSSVKTYKWDSNLKTPAFVVNDSTSIGTLASVDTTNDATTAEKVVVIVRDRTVKAVYILD